MSELDVLEAVRSVVATVESLGAKERERALRWSGELLEVDVRSQGADLTAFLYAVMVESIKEQNEEKKYWITRLAELNEIDEAISDYLKSLNDASRRLADMRREPEDDGSGLTVSIRRLEVKRVEGDDWVFDPAAQIPQDARDGANANLSVGDLSSLIAEVEAQRETVRNERRRFSSAFENANQTATQYLNMLALVLKTLSELAQGVIRNLR